MCKNHDTEAYLEPSRTSTRQSFYENFERLKAKKAPLQMFDWVLKMSLRQHQCHHSFEDKAWFSPMRLTNAHVYSCENKYKPFGGNALDNLKKINLAIFHDITE